MKNGLNPLFADGIVFQTGRPIRIFGSGDGVATVMLDGTSASAKSKDGFWLVELPARPCGGPFEMEVRLDGETVVVRDVWIGETILMSGQSNMQFKLRESKTDAAVFEDNPLVRLFTTRRPESGDRFGPADGWLRCRKVDAPDWPALPYFVANILQRRLGCPVGIAVAYQGGSTIQSWMPLEAFFDARFAIPDALKNPDHFAPHCHWNRTGILRDAVLHQLVPFQFGRVVWYQGESNASTAEGAVYDAMLEAMVAAWRSDFRTRDLPFHIVQIADYDLWSGEGWRAVQEAQERACARIPNAFLVRCADICETNEIHPPTKSRLAERLVESFGLGGDPPPAWTSEALREKGSN